MTEDHLRDVYVIVAFHSDKSGFGLVGCYELLRVAEDHVATAKGAGAMMELRIVKLKMNSSDPDMSCIS